MTIRQLCSSFGIFIFLSSFLWATPSLQELEKKYANAQAQSWGDHLPGIITRISTKEPYVFLTLDACSGKLDSRIIEFLRENRIPAMIFVNSRWIDLHKSEFLDLAKDDLFSIQNHGTLHKPLSISGRSVYHIQGTKNVAEVYAEVMDNDAKIFEWIHRHPKFFRSGTAYYDEVALSVLEDLNYRAVGYDVLGDAGATFSKEQMVKQADLVRKGSILIYHINHPEKPVYDGLRDVVKILKSRGFVFKKIEDFL